MWPHSQKVVVIHIYIGLNVLLDFYNPCMPRTMDTVWMLRYLFWPGWAWNQFLKLLSELLVYLTSPMRIYWIIKLELAVKLMHSKRHSRDGAKCWTQVFHWSSVRSRDLDRAPNWLYKEKCSSLWKCVQKLSIVWP